MTDHKTHHLQRRRGGAAQINCQIVAEREASSSGPQRRRRRASDAAPPAATCLPHVSQTKSLSILECKNWCAFRQPSISRAQSNGSSADICQTLSWGNGSQSGVRQSLRGLRRRRKRCLVPYRQSVEKRRFGGEVVVEEKEKKKKKVAVEEEGGVNETEGKKMKNIFCNYDVILIFPTGKKKKKNKQQKMQTWQHLQLKYQCVVDAVLGKTVSNNFSKGHPS